jgi:alpha-ribazole phosphatase/probable phosphoglycerate mutase
MDRMSEILFIRHAETDMAGTFCGRSDPELNARGRAQLGELTDQLRAKNIGAVYTSDLRRAQETGDAIAEAFAVDCYMRPTLREIDFGQWEGLTWKQIEQRDKIYARRWVAEYPRLSAPNGESFRDFEQRVLDEVKFLSMRAAIEGRRIAVVTHAGVLRLVLCVLHECSEDEAWEQTRPYCSIVRHPIAASSSAQMAEVES